MLQWIDSHVRRMAALFLAALAVLAVPPPAAADDGSAAAWTTAPGQIQVPTRPTGERLVRAVRGNPYRPAMRMGETRSAWTAPATPPTAFGLTSGEALTPARGQVALNWERLSDERFMIDLTGRRWESDGEINIVSLEAVSPRFSLRLGSFRIPLHVSASVHAYSLNTAILDEIRNWVEETLLFAEQGVIDNHDIGGRNLEIGPTRILDSTPLMKVRVAAKVPLPSTCLWKRRFDSAVSVGLTLPAFGGSNTTGNEDLAPDLTAAYRWTLSHRWAVTGALNLLFPGTSPRYDALGVSTKSVLFGSSTFVEFWWTPKFAVALGFQYQTPYVGGTGLAMDDASTYGTLGLLYRPHPSHAIHLMFHENPTNRIVNGASRDFDNAQRDADFAIVLGWRISL